MSTISKLFALLGLFLFSPALAQECGEASFYHDYYENKRTSSGTRFSQSSNQAAHRYAPFGSIYRVVSGGRSTTVRITDRGPFIPGRIIDLSTSSFSKLSSLSRGVIPVCIHRVR